MGSTEHTDTLVDMVVQRLKETQKPEQAAAVVRFGLIHLLLNALSKGVQQSLDQEFLALERAFADVRARMVYADSTLDSKGRAEEIPAVLTPLDADHRALVFDFDALVARVGDLALALEKPEVAERVLPQNVSSAWLQTQGQDTPHRADPKPGRPPRRPLRGTLAKLRPVGPLSERFQRPDLSVHPLRLTDFIRK